MDWAGFLLERVTGQTLHEYMQQHIFQPLRLTHISMIPNEQNQAKLACMHQRVSNGQLYVRKEHPLQRSLAIGLNPNDSPSSFCFSGGAGCFSTAHDYYRKGTLLPLNVPDTPGKRTELTQNVFQESYRPSSITAPVL